MPVDAAPPAVEAVVVSAALPPSPADAAFSILRLDPETINGRFRLDEALSSVPGVALFRRTSSGGANPTTQGLSLRAIGGSGAGRALVTLDGVPQNDPFGGWVIWSRLPPSDIGSVSIVRGAGAGPYGAGALTGVVSLKEVRPQPGAWAVTAEGGSLGSAGGSGLISTRVLDGVLVLSVAGDRSDGWIPVRAGRGPADTPLALADESASASFHRSHDGVDQVWRLNLYQEERGSGLDKARSRARGGGLSFTAAGRLGPDGALWRGQTWLQASDLFNTSVSVPAGRLTTTLTNDQYATPALGYGGAGALRFPWGAGALEIGSDFRGAVGEDRETFAAVAGALTKQRFAGGQTFTGGVYMEATQTLGDVLLTLGARLDEWASWDGHRRERVIASGVSTLNQNFAQRDGVVPTGRFGARWDFAPGLWVRSAGYVGFRAPTLNELFRPFRVGNIVTQANAQLQPETLYGVEAALGGERGRLAWSATGFLSRLEDPIINLTLVKGPVVDPVEGSIPAGGAIVQRRNVGRINTRGLEAEATFKLMPWLTLETAADWSRSRVDGGAIAPQLSGKRPAQTPDATVTADARLRLAGDDFTLRVRHESSRFEDDLNTIRLPAADTVDLRFDHALTPRASVFLALDNVFNAAVATGETTALVTSYGPPRRVTVGVRLRGNL